MQRLIPIISVAIILVLIAAGVLFWWPRYESFRDLKVLLERKEVELGQKKEYFDKLRETSRKLQNYQEPLAKIETAVPNEPSISSIFYFIQQVSAQSGLILQEIEIDAIDRSSDQTSEVGAITFSVNVAGAYPAFKNFLNAVYQSTRLIEIEKITLSTSKERGVLFDFDITLETHFAKEQPLRSRYQKPIIPKEEESL